MHTSGNGFDRLYSSVVAFYLAARLVEDVAQYFQLLTPFIFEDVQRRLNDTLCTPSKE
jgi:hypothetical protein